MKLTAFVTISLLSVAMAFPDEKVEPPPPAPLPARILQAKTILLSSEVGRIAYDEAYKCIRELRRFELTGDFEKADLIFALKPDVSVRPPRLRDIFFPYPMPSYEEYLWLIVSDAKSNLVLWSDVQLQQPAIKEKNRQKETILAVDVLFKRLGERIPAK